MLYVVPSVPRAAFEEGGGGVEVLLTLRRRLPPQLVPAQVVAVAALPLSPGGKLMRSRLPPPPPRAARLSPAAREGFRSETERHVAAAWAAALGAAVGPGDNFWQLGGTSLIAAKMLRLLQGSLGEEHGRDSFERGNQRFATRLCGLYRKPRLRDYCTWLDWAALPPPSRSPRAAAAFTAFTSGARTAVAAEGEAAGSEARPEEAEGAAARAAARAAAGEAEAARAAAAADADELLAAGEEELPEEEDLKRLATEALGAAAATGSARLVAALLAARASADGGASRAARGPTPLMRAVGREIAERQPRDSREIEPRDSRDMTPLVRAVGRERRVAAPDLLGSFSEASRNLPAGTWTCSRRAAAGVTVRLSSHSHASAAHLAAAGGHAASLRLLLRLGALLQARGTSERTTLYRHPKSSRDGLRLGAGHVQVDGALSRGMGRPRRVRRAAARRASALRRL